MTQSAWLATFPIFFWNKLIKNEYHMACQSNIVFVSAQEFHIQVGYWI